MEAIERAIDEDNLSEAAKLCKTLLRDNEYDVVGLYYNGIVNRKMKNYQLALKSHDTLINLLPDNPEYFAERGLTFHMLQDMDAALKDFNRAVELDKANPYRYSSRAFIKDYYGDQQGAVEDYYKAVELDPEDAIALNNLGIIEEKLGRIDQARQSFERSDKISGVDTKLKEFSTNSISKKADGAEVPDNNIKGWPNFLKTLGSLFTSAKERQSFIQFLRRKK